MGGEGRVSFISSLPLSLEYHLIDAFKVSNTIVLDNENGKVRCIGSMSELGRRGNVHGLML